MAITQLDCFRVTVWHRPREGLLFYANFSPDLSVRLRRDLGLAEDEDLGTHFGMYAPRAVKLESPGNREEPDFSSYYRDAEIPPGAVIDAIGVLHLPGSLYHFKR